MHSIYSQLQIHERGVESDFVLSLLLATVHLRLMEIDAKPLKLIIMSATIQTDRFSYYLSQHLGSSNQNLNSVPILHIPGKLYPVHVFYLETVKSLLQESRLVLGQHQDIDPTEITKVKNLKRGDGIPYRLMVILVFILSQNSKIHGAFLIFLPGIAEIFHFISLFEHLAGKYTCVSMQQFLLLPLHSSLSNDEQRKIFDCPPQGVTKIVVATNIAEASITIPDVTIVLDSCLVKEMSQTPGCKVCFSFNFLFSVVRYQL